MCIHCPTGGARGCEFGLCENLEIQRKGCWSKKVERWVGGGGEEKLLVSDDQEAGGKIGKRQVAASEADDEDANDSSGPATKKIRTSGGPEIPHDQKESQEAEFKIFNFKTANAKFKAIERP